MLFIRAAHHKPESSKGIADGFIRRDLSLPNRQPGLIPVLARAIWRLKFIRKSSAPPASKPIPDGTHPGEMPAGEPADGSLGRLQLNDPKAL
jgi:hypothetical protein